MPRLELLSPTGEIQKAIQRSLDLIAFGLQAAETDEINSLEMPGLSFQITPAGNLAMSPEDARIEFQSWVVTNGLRDCVDALGPSLEWARKICFLWSREGEIIELEDGNFRLSMEISGQAWNDFVVDLARDFEYWPLRKKIEYFSTEYKLPRFELAEDVLSINSARNCLTHRMGIVGPIDIANSEDDKLVVRWKKMEIRAQTKDGVRVLELPARVEKGDKVTTAFSTVTKEFSLGERIQISPTEFVEISTTFLMFALQLEHLIRDFQQARRTQA